MAKKKEQQKDALPILERASVIFYERFFGSKFHLLLSKERNLQDELVWNAYRDSPLSRVAIERGCATPEEAYQKALDYSVRERPTLPTTATKRAVRRQRGSV